MHSFDKSIFEKLEYAGLSANFDQPNLSYIINQPDSVRNSPSKALPANNNPLVSCLMVTRGNIDLLKFSLECYRRQTYKSRELVVVTQCRDFERVSNFLKISGIPNIAIYRADTDLTLGDLRNMALARAKGDIFMTWDDDDLNDPLRIEIFVSTLIETGAAAVYLSRLLFWWPHRQIAAISKRYLWEGSIAIWREDARVYPALPRDEDSAVSDFLKKNHVIAEIDAPHLYLYTITGQNTWGTQHFERMIQISDCVFKGSEFSELTSLLSNRVPIIEYHEKLIQRADNNE